MYLDKNERNVKRIKEKTGGDITVIRSSAANKLMDEITNILDSGSQHIGLAEGRIMDKISQSDATDEEKLEIRKVVGFYLKEVNTSQLRSHKVQQKYFPIGVFSGRVSSIGWR